MTKVVQALGRVIRSPEDRGLLVLIDSRFASKTYLEALPADWLPKDLRSLVSRSILADVDRFWQQKVRLSLGTVSIGFAFIEEG